MADWRSQTTAATEAPQPEAHPEVDATGSPGMVRLAVGSARPRDRLATIQKYFPDAKPYGDGNFVYTDPQTSRPTLYNPPGLDMGDLPAVTREAAQVLGGGIGALAGARGGIGGMLAGGTLGGAAADQVVDIARRYLGQPVSATPTETATDAGRDLLSQASGEATGMGIQALPGAIMRGLVRPGARAIADAAAAIGIRPTVGLLGGGPLGSTEHIASAILPMSRGARQQGRFAQEVQHAAQTAVPGAPFAPGEAAQQGGAALKAGAERGYARFRSVRQRLDNSVYAAFPAGASVPLTNTARVAQEIRARIAEAPETFGPQLQPVLDRVQAVLTDGQRAGGALPVQIHRNVRTLMGQELETEATTQLTREAQGFYRDAYAGMTTDLRAAAAATSPQALSRLNRHDRLVRAFRSEDLGRESVADSLDSILKAGSDEAAWSAMMSKTGGLNRLNNVMNRLDAGQRRVVARAAWDKMLTTPQGNPNLNYLMGQWNKADPRARQALFGSVTDMGRIDNLMTVLGGMRDADRSRNFSNSAHALIQAAIGDRAITEVVGKLGALVTGGAAAGSMFPTETMGAIGGAYLLSEAFHSPIVADALARAARGAPVEMTESLRRSIARAVMHPMADDAMGGNDQAPRTITNSTNANVSRNSPPTSGWRAMSTTP
jgi:hypothetical protein